MISALSLALLALAPYQDPEPKDESPWSGAVDAAVTAVNGNASSLTGTFNGKLQHNGKSTQSTLNLGYSGVRSDDSTGNAMTSARLYFGNVQHKQYFNEDKDFYAYGKGGSRRDVPNGLQIRHDIGVGAGRTFKLNEDGTTKLSVETGPSYLHENNVGNFTESAAAARVAGDLESALTDNLKLLGTSEYLISLDDSDNQLWIGQLSLRWNFMNEWFVQGSAWIAWDNTPGVGVSKTDTRYTLGIGTTF